VKLPSQIETTTVVRRPVGPAAAVRVSAAAAAARDARTRRPLSWTRPSRTTTSTATAIVVAN